MSKADSTEGSKVNVALPCGVGLVDDFVIPTSCLSICCEPNSTRNDDQPRRHRKLEEQSTEPTHFERPPVLSHLHFHLFRQLGKEAETSPSDAT